MLCPICNSHNLVFTFGEAPPSGERPQIVGIKCTPIGTGVLTLCKYTPGTLVFSYTATLYWMNLAYEKVLELKRIEHAEEIHDVLSDLNMAIREQEFVIKEQRERELRWRKKYEDEQGKQS